MNKDMKKEFDFVFPLAKSSGYEFVSGNIQNNHVEFIYTLENKHYRATMSWFPHLNYIYEDLEIKSVEARQKKVTVYE